MPIRLALSIERREFVAIRNAETQVELAKNMDVVFGRARPGDDGSLGS